MLNRSLILVPFTRSPFLRFRCKGGFILAKRDSFLLRLNPTTMDALRRWSEDEFRSMNSQIEMVLQRALKEAGRLPEKHPSKEEEKKPE